MDKKTIATALAMIPILGVNAGADSIETVSNPAPIQRASVKKTVTADVLNVRSGPGTTYSSIGKLYMGNVVEVISESGGWAKINYSGKIGYVSTDYLKSNESSSGGETSKPSGNQKSIQQVTSSILRVRSGAGITYSKVDTLHKGDNVTVESTENGWAKISYSGKSGYVSAVYLKFVEYVDEDSSGGSESSVIRGATVQRSSKSYSLDEMVEVQYIKAQNGGNLISRNNARTGEEVFTTYIIRNAEPRAYGKPTKDELRYYLDPANFEGDSSGLMQFVRLDRYTNTITADSLNKYFASKGTDCVFNGKGQAFIDTAKKYNIDVLYFVSHAMWETGNGKSALAKGQVVTSVDGVTLDKPVTVYNFFGIGAVDGNALEAGKLTAYKNGWTTIEKGIDGAAKWISDGYIHNSKYNQNTVYAMRWNYEYSWHQYATDVNWANGIATMMSSLMEKYGTGEGLLIDIPDYK